MHVVKNKNLILLARAWHEKQTIFTLVTSLCSGIIPIFTFVVITLK